ncbi:MAG: helix-turn-helix domain-containing protein [Bryobacterales bacterium]|nr:helix-turn-helix domain-containing protein [Bryobacterales bacterium]
MLAYLRSCIQHSDPVPRPRPEVRAARVPASLDVQVIRKRTGLSQAEFARRYGFNVRTLQDWERGRGMPDGAVRAYLTVIAKTPKAVEKALA